MSDVDMICPDCDSDLEVVDNMVEAKMRGKTYEVFFLCARCGEQKEPKRSHR